MQEDTYRGGMADPLSLNLYTYCAGNPIKFWDPSGLAQQFVATLANGATWNEYAGKSGAYVDAKTGGTLSYNQKTGASSFSTGGVTVSGVLGAPAMQNKSTNEMLGNLRSVTIELNPLVLMSIRYSEAYANLNHKNLHQLKEWDQLGRLR